MSVGEVEITLLVDASIRLRYRDLNVFIDPYAADDLTAEDFAELGPADLIFLTHEDSGHFAPATITALTGERTLVLAPLFPAWILAFLADRIRVVSLREGDHRQLRGIGVDVLPMHNIVHEQEVGGPRHREGQGVGYLLTLGEARIYVSGDTECAPAIQALEDVDVAFLSVNEESMWPSEAAACVAAFRPKIVVPYHIRGVDLGALTQAFADALADATGIELRVLDPGGTGADASDL
ncbi:MAG: MBL fold metallo-hydrolase [Nannocystaceae bacterium]